MSRPKPEDQRRNFSAQRKTARALAQICEPPATPEGLCPEAAAWFESLIESGQASFYQASDWQMAVTGAHLLNDWYDTKRSTSMTAWQKICDRLLTAEAGRRAALMELQPATAPKKNTSASDAYKASLGVVK